MLQNILGKKSNKERKKWRWIKRLLTPGIIPSFRSLPLNKVHDGLDSLLNSIGETMISPIDFDLLCTTQCSTESAKYFKQWIYIALREVDYSQESGGILNRWIRTSLLPFYQCFLIYIVWHIFISHGENNLQHKSWKSKHHRDILLAHE